MLMTWIREKFGTVLIAAIIGFIAFVFVFYGVVSPRATRGLHEGAVAGTVNGEAITLPEFNRELSRRVEMFKNMGGGKFSEEQLKAFKIREGVFQELTRRKLLVQEAERAGISASDEEVREKVREIPAFQKDGQFDLLTYKEVLTANRYTPASFERLMREDLSVQQWQSFFRRRVQVSKPELENEFILTHDKRNLKYVVLSPEHGRKGVTVSDDQVEQFLAGPTKLNLTKARYEQAKETLFKGKTFDQVKKTIAKDILGAEKNDEVQKVVDKLADQVLAQLSGSKTPDPSLVSLLKAYGAEVKLTGFITRSSRYLPGIGEAKDLSADAFSGALDGKAKKYKTASQTVIARVVDTERPDTAKFLTERESLMRQLLSRKERGLFESWMNQVQTKAKIDPNPDVVSSAAGGGA